MRDCYQACFNALVEGEFRGSDVKLAHGFPRLRTPDLHAAAGDVYGHAWLEVGEVCINLRPVVKIVPKVLYYQAGQIDPTFVTFYSGKEALDRAILSGHTGPWEEKQPPGAKFAPQNIEENNKKKEK